MKEILLSDVIERVQTNMGNLFNTYDMKVNNCQNYVTEIVRAVFNLNDFQVPRMIHDYIYQDLKKYINTFVQKIGRLITDFSHASKRLLFGGDF